MHGKFLIIAFTFVSSIPAMDLLGQRNASGAAMSYALCATVYGNVTVGEWLLKEKVKPGPGVGVLTMLRGPHVAPGAFEMVGPSAFPVLCRTVIERAGFRMYDAPNVVRLPADVELFVTHVSPDTGGRMYAHMTTEPFSTLLRVVRENLPWGATQEDMRMLLGTVECSGEEARAAAARLTAKFTGQRFFLGFVEFVSAVSERREIVG